ncbi:hypothetical protein LEN26_004084 [Aphanomyces euteiches]|nr:hypothetical protein LEN26_004084 [Aphanomyces euteiches]
MQNASFAVFGFGFSDISSFRVPELCDLITNDRVGAGVMYHDESKLSVEETMRDCFDVGDMNENHEYPRASRHLKKFATVDDVILLQVVNAFRPWRAPAGTASGIMKVFDDIAVHCAKQKNFGVKKNGPALRTRFPTLAKE